MRVLVDPRFPAKLRELRRQRGWSLADLARHSVGKSTVSDLENGRKKPSLDMVAHLDRVLDAGGALSGLVSAAPAVADEDQGRVQHAIARPQRLDSSAVEAFARLLASQRRLDDAVAAHLLLPGITPQWQVVHQVARDARGPHANGLRTVAAEWTQFVGWLHAEARLDTPARKLLEQARVEAAELDSGELVAQAIDFRGWLARQRGEHLTAARAYEAMVATPGTSVPQRVIGMTHAGYSLGRSGQIGDAERMLAGAQDLAEEVQDPPSTAYWLSPAFMRLGLGMALAGLGDRPAAAEQLRAGLDGLPADWVAAEWATEYREALSSAMR